MDGCIKKNIIDIFYINECNDILSLFNRIE